jgi:hypothetical protein
VLSGSPVAATTISLFGAGSITKLETLTMLLRLRLGASFIVLVTGFLYTLRNKSQRSVGLGVGIQAMTMTMVQYLPGMVLRSSSFAAARSTGSSGTHRKLDAVLGRLWGPIVDAAEARLPGWALFVVGIATILLSFNLIDRVLPQIDSNAPGPSMKTADCRAW